MRKAVPILMVALAALALGSRVAVAQQKPVVWHVAGGVSLPQGDAGKALDSGWVLNGGATWYPWPARSLGVRFDVGVDWWDASNDFLSGIDTEDFTPGIQPPDDGDARVWRFNANLLWEHKGNGAVGFYLAGGVGVEYADWHISEEGLAQYWYCDWWGWCYPVVGEADYIIQDGSSWEWGANAAAGLTFGLRSGTQFYIEAGYHWIDTDNGATWVPITIGARF